MIFSHRSRSAPHRCDQLTSEGLKSPLRLSVHDVLAKNSSALKLLIDYAHENVIMKSSGSCLPDLFAADLHATPLCVVRSPLLRDDVLADFLETGPVIFDAGPSSDTSSCFGWMSPNLTLYVRALAIEGLITDALKVGRILIVFINDGTFAVHLLQMHRLRRLMCGEECDADLLHRITRSAGGYVPMTIRHFDAKMMESVTAYAPKVSCELKIVKPAETVSGDAGQEDCSVRLHEMDLLQWSFARLEKNNASRFAGRQACLYYMTCNDLDGLAPAGCGNFPLLFLSQPDVLVSEAGPMMRAHIYPTNVVSADLAHIYTRLVISGESHALTFPFTPIFRAFMEEVLESGAMLFAVRCQEKTFIRHVPASAWAASVAAATAQAQQYNAATEWTEDELYEALWRSERVSHGELQQSCGRLESLSKEFSLRIPVFANNFYVGGRQLSDALFCRVTDPEEDDSDIEF